MKLMNATLSTLLILAIATAKTTASPISKVASGETVKLTQIFDVNSSEINMGEIPFLDRKLPNVDFVQNTTSWITPTGIRALQVSTILILNKDFTIQSDKDGNNHITIFLHKDTNGYTYGLDPKNQTATRWTGSIAHEVDALSHSKPDSSQSIFLKLFMSLMRPGTISTQSFLKYFHPIGNGHLLNYSCQKMTYQLSKKQKQSIDVWVAHINGKSVILRINIEQNRTPYVILDTLSIKSVNPPKDFLNVPAGYKIKVSKV